MPHISLPLDLPGILGPMSISPETAKPLLDLANQLLHRETPGLSRAERELLGSYVSYLNGCVYCFEVHGAVADHHQNQPGWARSIWNDSSFRNVSKKMRQLLIIAGKIQGAPREVSNADIAAAKAEGATDLDIHDTVLIASAFCMFNRYVDGLASRQPPRGDEFYKTRGAILARDGYKGQRS
jgi:uncharacterized peroxidase-related enzyme